MLFRAVGFFCARPDAPDVDASPIDLRDVEPTFPVVAALCETVWAMMGVEGVRERRGRWEGGDRRRRL